MDPIERRVRLNRSRVFPATASAVPEIRRFVAGVLGDLGLESEDALLVVSELAGNAALHAGGETIAVSVALLTDGTIRLGVQDRSPALAIVRRLGSDEEGWGIQLVRAIADDWGVEYHDHTKTVWADLRRDLIEDDGGYPTRAGRPGPRVGPFR